MPPPCRRVSPLLRLNVTATTETSAALTEYTGTSNCRPRVSAISVDVTLRTAEREHLIEEPLVALEREFAERLVRIHRSCLVARAAIRGFERNPGDEEAQWLVVLDGVAEKLPVSRRQWPVVRELVSDK